MSLDVKNTSVKTGRAGDVADAAPTEQQRALFRRVVTRAVAAAPGGVDPDRARALLVGAEVVTSMREPTKSKLDDRAAVLRDAKVPLSVKRSKLAAMLANEPHPLEPRAREALAAAYLHGDPAKTTGKLRFWALQAEPFFGKLDDALGSIFKRAGLPPEDFANFQKLATPEDAQRKARRATHDANAAKLRSAARPDLKLSMQGLPGTEKSALARLFAGLGVYGARNLAHQDWFRPLTNADFGFDPFADLGGRSTPHGNYEALLAHLGSTAPRRASAEPAATFATNDSGVRAEGERYDLLAEERDRADARAAGYKAAAEALLPPTIAKRFDKPPLIFDPLPGDGPGGARARQAVFTAGPSGTGKTEIRFTDGSDLVPERQALEDLRATLQGELKQGEGIRVVGIGLGPAAGAQIPFGDNPRLDDARTAREIAESIGAQLRELADGAIKSVKQK